MTKKGENNWFAIASLVLSIVWLILLISVIGTPLGIIAIILWLIFGIIALNKKQKKSTAITGIVISGIVLILSTVMTIVWIKFIQNNKDVLIDPVVNFSAMVAENPDLLILMNNDNFENEFESLFQIKMIEKFGSGFEWKWWDEIKNEIPGIFEEMQNIMLSLKDKYQTELPVDVD